MFPQYTPLNREIWTTIPKLQVHVFMLAASYLDLCLVFPEFSTLVLCGWFSVILATQEYICFQTICNQGVHFCHQVNKRCELCEDYKKTCFTVHHQPNCTTFCNGKFKSSSARILLFSKISQCDTITVISNRIC